MRITSSGDVGIGTDTPSSKLEVRNSTGLAKIKIRGDDGATSTRAELHIDRTRDARGGGIRIEQYWNPKPMVYRFSLQWRFII